VVAHDGILPIVREGFPMQITDIMPRFPDQASAIAHLEKVSWAADGFAPIARATRYASIIPIYTFGS
jgi:hypothetical protein